MDTSDLVEGAKAVLKENNRGPFTVPAEGLYPHQWLWDSCFIAIGMRHYDLDQAQAEVLRLLDNQWANGMVPHMILGGQYRRDRHSIWRSWLNPNSPDNVTTSGITQPPMLAEAIVQIGKKLGKAERRTWYKTVYPRLLKYHMWLYTERDPHNEGLVLQIHPWETGFDNTPPWMDEMHQHLMPFWVQIVQKTKLDKVITLFRRDTHRIASEQLLATIDAMVLYSTQRRIRRKNYDINRILSHSLFAIEDLAFNCIFVRANQLLLEIAAYIKEELPHELIDKIQKTEASLEQLWDPYSSQYYSRNFVTHKLIKQPTIAALLPLYAGVITKDRAKYLLRMLENQHIFGTNYPVPSVPVNSEWFNPIGYWQGPTWVNVNWLIIDGLRRAGHNDYADALRETTLEMVHKSGYF